MINLQPVMLTTLPQDPQHYPPLGFLLWPQFGSSKPKKGNHLHLFSQRNYYQLPILFIFFFKIDWPIDWLIDFSEGGVEGDRAKSQADAPRNLEPHRGFRAPSHHLEIMSWVATKSQVPKQPSHPGAFCFVYYSQTNCTWKMKLFLTWKMQSMRSVCSHWQMAVIRHSSGSSTAVVRSHVLMQNFPEKLKEMLTLRSLMENCFH